MNLFYERNLTRTQFCEKERCEGFIFRGMIVRNSAKQKIVDCVDFDGDENFSWAERNIEDR